MVRWHHWLKGHEFEQALGDGEGQGSLACCSPQGHKESHMTEQLNNSNTVLELSSEVWKGEPREGVIVIGLIPSYMWVRHLLTQSVHRCPSFLLQSGRLLFSLFSFIFVMSYLLVFSISVYHIWVSPIEKRKIGFEVYSAITTTSPHPISSLFLHHCLFPATGLLPHTVPSDSNTLSFLDYIILAEAWVTCGLGGKM